MKKIIGFCNVLLCVAVILGLGACASSPTVVMGKHNQPMPDWIYKTPKAEDAIYFVSDPFRGTTDAYSLGQAKANCNNKAAQWVETTVESFVKSYMDESGEVGNTQALTSFKSLVITKAKASLSALQEEEKWIDLDGNAYMLCKLEKSIIDKSFKSSVNDFVRNESAAFAEFKADEFQKEMYASIDLEMEK